MDPEDARIYHKTQQTQKPAGGAFFEEHRHQGPYEVGMSSGKGGYTESVESLSGDSVYDKQQSQQQYRTTSPLSNVQNDLAVPKAAYAQPSTRDSPGTTRQGRSPLAQESYRSAPGNDASYEMQQPQNTSLMRDVSPAPMGHSRSDSTDSKKRKRLTKDRK